MPHEDLSLGGTGWRAIAAFFGSLVAPVAVARRSDRVPLWAAALVHLVGLMMGFIVWVGLELWSSSGHFRALTISSWWRKFEHAIVDIVEEAADPVAWVYLGATLLAIEGGVVVLAWALMSWGARPERVTDSFIRTLRRVWLLTPFAATLLLILWGGVVLGVGGHGPFDWRINTILGTVLLVLGVAAALWIVLRAVSTADGNRARPACRWPPGCETCGYTLFGSERPSTCPECGAPAAQSLADSSRDGIPWARRKQIGRCRAWITTTVDAIVRPARLGQSLLVLSPDTGRGSFLAVNLTLIFATGVALPLILSIVYSRQYTYIHFELADLLPIWFGAGLTLTVIALAWLLLSASFVGTLVGARVQRNLLPAAMQASCCLGGLVTGWLIVTWLAVCAAIYFDETGQLRSIARRMRIDEEVIVLGTFSTIGIAALASYLFAHWRIVYAARYANR